VVLPSPAAFGGGNGGEAAGLSALGRVAGEDGLRVVDGPLEFEVDTARSQVRPGWDQRQGEGAGVMRHQRNADKAVLVASREDVEENLVGEFGK
jgi:hypothetical protein